MLGKLLRRPLFCSTFSRWTKCNCSKSAVVNELQHFLSNCGVTVTVRVPSVVEYLHRATVCVVPMRIGFGIKNKTLEAMAAGVPVVASDRGLEGLAIDQPQRALRATTTDDYVTAIGHLFDQPALRATLAQQGRKLIETTFTWERAGQAYDTVLTA